MNKRNLLIIHKSQTIIIAYINRLIYYTTNTRIVKRYLKQNLTVKNKTWPISLLFRHFLYIYLNLVTMYRCQKHVTFRFSLFLFIIHLLFVSLIFYVLFLWFGKSEWRFLFIFLNVKMNLCVPKVNFNGGFHILLNRWRKCRKRYFVQSQQRSNIKSCQVTSNGVALGKSVDFWKVPNYMV